MSVLMCQGTKSRSCRGIEPQRLLKNVIGDRWKILVHVTLYNLVCCVKIEVFRTVLWVRRTTFSWIKQRNQRKLFFSCAGDWDISTQILPHGWAFDEHSWRREGGGGLTKSDFKSSSSQYWPLKFFRLQLNFTVLKWQLTRFFSLSFRIAITCKIKNFREKRAIWYSYFDSPNISPLYMYHQSWMESYGEFYLYSIDIYDSC